MAQIVEKTTVARGLTLDGRPFSIHKLTHDVDVAGVGKDTYSVDVSAAEGTPGTATGFASYADARRYVTGGTDTFDTFDAQGQKQTVEREGLYVPAGAMWEAQPKTTTAAKAS